MPIARTELDAMIKADQAPLDEQILQLLKKTPSFAYTQAEIYSELTGLRLAASQIILYLTWNACVSVNVLTALDKLEKDNVIEKKLVAGQMYYMIRPK